MRCNTEMRFVARSTTVSLSVQAQVLIQEEANGVVGEYQKGLNPPGKRTCLVSVGTKLSFAKRSLAAAQGSFHAPSLVPLSPVRGRSSPPCLFVVCWHRLSTQCLVLPVTLTGKNYVFVVSTILTRVSLSSATRTQTLNISYFFKPSRHRFVGCITLVNPPRLGSIVAHQVFHCLSLWLIGLTNGLYRLCWIESSK